MKRIQSACIMQTLRFQQKDGTGLPAEALLQLNMSEVTRYKAQLDYKSGMNTAHDKGVEEGLETAARGGTTVIPAMGGSTGAEKPAPVGDYFD